jgi:hypothetical protein
MGASVIRIKEKGSFLYILFKWAEMQQCISLSQRVHQIGIQGILRLSET